MDVSLTASALQYYCYMTLCSHLWICYYYLLISLSCGIYCNCVKHNYSASDLEGNVITEQQDSYDIECYMCLYICTFPW